MEGNHWKNLGEAILDGEALELGVYHKASGYVLTVEQREDDTYFMIRRKDDGVDSRRAV